MRKVGWVLSISVLFLTGIVGLLNGVREIGDVHSRLQLTVTCGVLLYGVLGLAAGVGLARRRPWSVNLSVAWAIVVTYVSTVASFAYSDPTFSQSGTLAGTVAAGVSTALIGAAVVWVARVATRAQNLPHAGASDHIPSL
jgi:hypothetical protein